MSDCSLCSSSKGSYNHIRNRSPSFTTSSRCFYMSPAVNASAMLQVLTKSIIQPRRRRLAQPYVLEPVRPAVFFHQERLAICKPPRCAAAALGRVGAVEIWDVLVADITEPVTFVSGTSRTR